MRIILLCLAGFVAAIFDSIAGGGGIITVPALLAAGIPPHYTLGTNKFAASWGAMTSSLTFLRSRVVYLPLIKYIIPFTLLGASLGVKTALHIDPKYLQTIVIVMLIFVTFYTVLKKGRPEPAAANCFQMDNKKVLIGCSLGFVLGFYDGFFGPGTGSFLLFSFVHLFKFNYTTSAANARILNFCSNLTSLLLFAVNGKIFYTIGLPMAICMALGGRIGSKIALKHGSKIIKPIFITMSVLMISKLIIDSL